MVKLNCYQLNHLVTLIIKLIFGCLKYDLRDKGSYLKGISIDTDFSIYSMQYTYNFLITAVYNLKYMIVRILVP